LWKPGAAFHAYLGNYSLSTTKKKPKAVANSAPPQTPTGKLENNQIFVDRFRASATHNWAEAARNSWKN